MNIYDEGYEFEIDYEIKTLTPEGRVEISRARELGLTEVVVPQYTLEKHVVGSHYEILADLTNLQDAQQLLHELKEARGIETESIPSVILQHMQNKSDALEPENRE